MKNSRKKGFTLLEIIAVITLLIVISSIAIPTYTNIVDTQRKRADVVTALQLSEIAKTYYIETKDTTETKLSEYIQKQFGGELPKSQYSGGDFSVTYDDNNKPNVSVTKSGEAPTQLVKSGKANEELAK